MGHPQQPKSDRRKCKNNEEMQFKGKEQKEWGNHKLLTLMTTKKRKRTMRMKLEHPMLGLMSMLESEQKSKETKTKKGRKCSHLLEIKGSILEEVLSTMDKLTKLIIWWCRWWWQNFSRWWHKTRETILHRLSKWMNYLCRWWWWIRLLCPWKRTWHHKFSQVMKHPLHHKRKRGHLRLNKFKSNLQ